MSMIDLSCRQDYYLLKILLDPSQIEKLLLLSLQNRVVQHMADYNYIKYL